eukprot:XP_001689445.1 predicted protein [Chlamydomonas reinhardtii]
MASDNAPAGPLLSEESSACLLDRLDSNILVSILSFLTPREVVTASLTCKQLAAAAEAPVLWRQLYDSALCPRVKERHLPHPSQARRGISDWRGVVVRGLLLRELPHGAWERLQPEGNRQLRPCPREGHAASSWGRDSMILFGGWGSGIRNDLYILERPPQPGGAPWVLPEQDEPCGWQWRVPRVAGRKPPVRYGHSATRCGPDGGWLAVYGGMQAGGYAAEISSLALLRPFSDLDPADYEYEWYLPQLSGADPGARGYHSACASEDGMRLFVFGGIARRGSTTRLSVIDLRTLTVDRPTTTGGGPSPRFGCSLFCYGGKLWVVGGGNGSDLARSGVDLFDVWTLDLKSWEWAELLMFGGSLELGNHITWLDVGACPAPVWGHPAAVLGAPPGKRMSAVAAISRTDLLVFGGWIYSCGEMGDLHRYKLLLTHLKLMREAQEREERSGHVPLALVRQMHETMMSHAVPSLLK